MKRSQLSKNRLAKNQVITIKDEVVEEESKAQSEEEPGPSGVLELLDQQEKNFKLVSQAARQAASQAEERAKKAEDKLKASKRDDEKRLEELKKRVEELSSELQQYKRGGMQLMQQLQLQQQLLPREEQLQTDLSSILSAVRRLQAKSEEYREAASLAEKHRQAADEWRCKYIESQSRLDSTSQKCSLLEEKYAHAVRMAKAVHAASSALAAEEPLSLQSTHSLTPPASEESGRDGEIEKAVHAASSALAAEQPVSLQSTHSLPPPASEESGRDGEIEKVAAPSRPHDVQGILKKVKTEEGTSEKRKEPSVSLQSTPSLTPPTAVESGRDGEIEKVAAPSRPRGVQGILKRVKTEEGESEKRKEEEEKEKRGEQTRRKEAVSLQSTHSLAPSDRRESARSGVSAVSSPLVRARPSENSKRAYRETLKDVKKENGEKERSKRNERKEKSGEEMRKEATRTIRSARPKRTLLKLLDDMESEEGTRKKSRRDEEVDKEKEAKKDGASGEKRVKVERMEEDEREIRVKEEK